MQTDSTTRATDDRIVREILAGQSLDEILPLAVAGVLPAAIPLLRAQSERVTLLLEECGFSRAESARLRFVRWLVATGRLSEGLR